MKYEYLFENDGIKIYARVENNGKCYVTCSENDADYQSWLAEQDAETL